MSEQIYQAPDLRKQTLKEAEAFLTEKRVRRMVIILNAKEKLDQKLQKLHTSESVAFEKRLAKVTKAKEAVEKALSDLEKAIDRALSSDNSLTNIEQERLQL